MAGRWDMYVTLKVGKVNSRRRLAGKTCGNAGIFHDAGSY